MGVVPLLGGIVDVSRHFPRSRPGRMSVGESLASELDRHDDGVLDVVPLFGASRLETRLGGPTLHSSGARSCPRLIFRGTMHDVAA